MKLWKNWKNSEDPEIPPDLVTVNENLWWDPTSGSLPFDFCTESSLHGLKFIGQPKRHFTERIFWLIAFTSAVVVAVIFIVQTWDKYQKTPVITVFQPTETRIHSIPFPAITICNSNNVLKAKANEFIQRAAEEVDGVTAFNELYLLDHVCHASTTFAETFNFQGHNNIVNANLTLRYQEFQKQNPTIKNDDGRPFTDLLIEVSQKCSDMILLCKWHGEIQNCSELFDEVETDFGYCCSFNLAPVSLLLSLRDDSRDDRSKVKEWADLDLDSDKLITPNNEYPKHVHPEYQFRSGRTSGLSVLLDPDLDSYFCTNTDSGGFIALAHLPLAFPRISDLGHAIKPNSEMFLQIRPEVTVPDANIKGFSLEKRKCYFGKEHSLKYYNYYTVSNCEDECIANLTYSECQCVRYYMPRDENQTLCGPNKFNCTETVRKGTKRRNCNCLPTCTEIEYHTSSSYMPLRQDVPLWIYPNGTEAHWARKNVSILHVFFSIDSTYPKLRTEIYGFLDLLSNTGGLLGLCLGFSALSLLEIFYFVTLRVFCRSKRGKRVRDRLYAATKYAWVKASGSKKSWPDNTVILHTNKYSNHHVNGFNQEVILFPPNQPARDSITTFPTNESKKVCW